jgi:hypothetical protein
MNLLREPDAGDPHVRFDEREVETERIAATAPPLDSTVCVQGEAVLEMRVVLSQPEDRIRLQTDWSSGGQEPSW